MWSFLVLTSSLYRYPHRVGTPVRPLCFPNYCLIRLKDVVDVHHDLWKCLYFKVSCSTNQKLQLILIDHYTNITFKTISASTHTLLWSLNLYECLIPLWLPHTWCKTHGSRISSLRGVLNETLKNKNILKV